jgi:hypothetical protein
MRAWKVWVYVLFFLILGVSPLAAAPAVLAIFAGRHEVLDGGEGSTAGAEGIFAPRKLHFLPRFVPALAPVGGLLVASRGSLYVYGGFRFDVPLGERWVATPGFAAGLFHRGGEQDLGGPVEFRSSIELAYRFSESSRLGLNLSHLSNGGLYDRNPGTESLVLVWSAAFKGPVLSSRPGGDIHGR